MYILQQENKLHTRMRVKFDGRGLGQRRDFYVQK